MGGDFFADPVLPEGHDVILLSRIFQDWSEEKNRLILRKCNHALPSGGAVIISQLFVNDEKTGPAPAALMSLNMLIETEGRNYTASECVAWLRELDFRDIEILPFDSPGANGVVVAYKS